MPPSTSSLGHVKTPSTGAATGHRSTPSNGSNTASAPAASTAPAPSRTTAKKPSTTIDSLTANLGSAFLDHDNDDPTKSLDAAALKHRLLNPAPDDDGGAPPLAATLQSLVSGSGGEYLLHVGGRTKTGDAVPFSEDEVDRAVANIAEVCKVIDCASTVVHRSSGDAGVTSTSNVTSEQGTFPSLPTPNAYVMLRRVAASAEELLELRIAVIGNVDAGKSSTLGVLTKGTLDDGRGKARVNLFRHKHEIETGRTSSVGMEIMGFDAKGDVVMNQSDVGRKMSWEDVCGRASKVISFIDLAGHERYLKTTVGGLTGCLPDVAIMMIGANAGLIGMSKEHLGVALALALPVIVCITKIDMTPPHILEATIKQLTKILRSPGCRKTPVFIESPAQVVEAATRVGSERICPIFQISNVTGHNLPLLRSFLNVLPQTNATKFSSSAPFKFQLQDVFSVPFTGTVVSGVILSGSVKVGDNLVIGPDSLGQFMSTSVRSIQRKRVNVEVATAGQSASFALRRIRRNQVRKGMVMLAKTESPPQAHMTCDAEILCLYHSTTLSVGSCMVLHAASIRQTVRITAIAKLDSAGKAIASTATAHRASKDSSDRPVVRTGDRAMLRLQFIRFAEFIEPGARLITREGKTKLIGVIRRVGSDAPLVPPAEDKGPSPPVAPAPPANATAAASA